MANITIATTDTWLPEVWSTVILDTLHKNVVLLPLTDRRYEKMLSSISPGDTIRVPAVAELTATKLTNMTGTVTFTANTEAATTNIVINVLGLSPIKIDFAAKVLNYLATVELYGEEAGRSLAELIDTDISTELDATTNTKGTDNVALTETVLGDSKLVLDNNKVARGNRVFVHSPAMFQDMYNIERYTNSLYGAAIGQVNAAKGLGYDGHILDFDLYETTNLPSGSAGKKGFMFHPSGIAVVMAQDIRVERRLPHDELAEAIIPWCVYGVKLMAAARVVEVDGR